MRLGFGLYRNMLNEDYYRFAKQCGATDIIVHLCDYGEKSQVDANKVNQPVGDKDGWGIADHSDVWSLDELINIRKELEAYDLSFYGVENFDPAQWHDILLDGPKRDEQLLQAQEQIKIFAEAGIKVFGYNFSIGGVAGRETLTTRGGAVAVGLNGVSEAIEKPLPKGMVWNMVYDSDAQGVLETITSDQLWHRLEVFLKSVIPTAEKYGLILAAHPDDPPLAMVRQQPRLVYRHHSYQRLIDLVPSTSNQLELCVGTLSEMQDDDLYKSIEKYAVQNKVAYVHLRNVAGKVPNYTETFLDDGDIDVGRVLRVLNDTGFEGVIIPDHAPQMTCQAPWHSGMAFAMGYLRSKIESVTGAKV